MEDSGETQKVDWRFIIIVFVLAFIVRAGYVFLLDSGKFYFDDSLQWNQIALNFMAGKGFIVVEYLAAFRMPLYPAFLSGIYYLFGSQNLLAVRLFQAGLSALTCVLIYLTGTALFGRRAGKLSAAVSVFYPFFIYYSGAVLTETLYIFLLGLFVWLTVKRRHFWAAVPLGFAVLCRAEIFGFIIFLAPALFISIRSKKNALRTSIVMVAIICAVMSWWVGRNYVLFGRIVPLTTMGGRIFWEGNNPRNNTGGPCHYFPVEAKGLDEVQMDKYWKRKTLDTIGADPKRFLALCVKKFFRFWNIRLNTDNPRYASRRNNLVSMVSFGPVLLFFIAGFVMSLGGWRRLMPVYLLILYIMLVNLVFVSSLRYRLPIEPYLIIFAGHSFSYLWGWLWKKCKAAG